MTTKADTSVKWFTSGMPNGPILRGQAGALIELLDACLINGFDPRPVNAITVSGGVATVTISAGNPFEAHAVIRITGVTGDLSALNDDWRIATAGASTFTFTCPGIADGAADGTITVKRAPAGWTKQFAATHKAVYRSSEPYASGNVVRFDDADARTAYVRGYESMADADTGEGPFPTTSQVSGGGLRWHKSSTANASARNWELFCDGGLLHLFIALDTSYGADYEWYTCGDIVSFVPGDGYHHALTGFTVGPYPFPGHDSVHVLDNAVFRYMPRNVAQSAGAIEYVCAGSLVTNVPGYNGATYPAAADNGVHLHAPVLVIDGTQKTGHVRGILPGFLQPINNCQPLRGQTLNDLPEAGRAVRFIGASSPWATYVAALDIVGPWR